MNSLTRLQDLLRSLFQYDQADLDFGIYRLLRLKRDEVETFLTDQLPRTVAEAFQTQAGEDRERLEQRLEALAAKVRQDIAADALSEDGAVKPEYAALNARAIRELVEEYESARAALQTAQAGDEATEEVFNHLYSFFSRYYEDGDFMPRRYYGQPERYSVPYNGEDALFTWANRDQHYVKSGERFRDYAFAVNTTLGDYRVRFCLVEASAMPGNAKGDIRFFFPLPEAIEWDEDRRFVTVPFCYRVPTAEEIKTEAVTNDGKKLKGQEAILAETEPAIRAAIPDDVLAAALGPSANGDGKDATVLLRRLRHFTRQNKTDFFVHKNLRGFLDQELEFYLKDQFLRLDDLYGDLDARVRSLRVLRRIAADMVAFLAQIEDFQKRIFEKRKFVIKTHYLLPVCKVPRRLWPVVLANSGQVQEWMERFFIEPKRSTLNPSGGLNEQFLEEQASLVVNTEHFDERFKCDLLTELGDLEQITDGVLVHSENYQALRLLQAVYRNRVDCIYIDPPYNTGDDGFPYKDAYRHSTWLTMMEERLELGRSFQTITGTLAASIDDIEVAALQHLLDATYDGQALAKLVWDRNRKNDATFFSVGHEYMLVYANDKESLKSRVLREPVEGLDDAKLVFEQLKRKHGEEWDSIRRGWMEWFKGIAVSDPRRRMMRFSKVGSRGPYRDDGDISWPGGGGPRYEILHPQTKRPVRIPARGWVYPTAERFWEEYNKGRIIFGPDETTSPSPARYLFETEGQVMPSVFYSYAQTAAQEFDAFFTTKVFKNPKNWRDLARLFRYLGSPGSTILDFFAGSGSTAHALIALDRSEDNDSHRRFVLVDMAREFQSVLVPRVAKVMYSPEWQDGRPVRSANEKETERGPRLVKVVSLESYEDALHNLTTEEELARQEQRVSATRTVVGEARYRLSYLLRLPFEAGDSLLNIRRLEHPFNYTIDVLTDAGPRVETVDLVETFNYLAGLCVQRLQVWRNEKDGGREYRVVFATNRESQRVCVMWRDMDALDAERERAFLEPQLQQAGPFDLTWINGDSAVPGVRSLDAEFARLMEEEA